MNTESTLLQNLLEKVTTRYAADSLGTAMLKYKADPAGFAHKVLGSTWWYRQEDIARALVTHRRVAVKSANGVGKTYVAADIALWFLYTQQPAIVLTTAPTWRQVRFVLWEEIRKRYQQANSPFLHQSRSPRNRGAGGINSPGIGGRGAAGTGRANSPFPRREGGRGRRLPGSLFATRLQAGDQWYAIGLATDKPDKFQGFHQRNLLIIFDEASGIPDPIWAAAEGVAVGENNKILAIGNPLRAEGRFYRIFAGKSVWHKMSISAMEHPNITGIGPPIPGCVTLDYLEDRIQDWCEPIQSTEVDFLAPARDLNPCDSSPPNLSEPDVGKGPPLPTESPPDWGAGGPRGQPSNKSDPSNVSEPDTRSSQVRQSSRSRHWSEGLGWSEDLIDPIPCITTPDTFTFKGRTYTPNNLFRARVLALFPDAGDESLIPIRWIEAAAPNRRTLPTGGYIRAAIDVARFGDDDTVIAIRNGPVVEPFCVVHGNDTMAIAERIKQLAYARHPHSIAVDSIGIGAGVVDRLRQMGIEGVVPMNVARAAHDQELFANRRAELYWGIRERFHEGTIVIPNDEKLVEELAAIRYVLNSRGQIQIEPKAEMKRRLGGSPDRADALAMLMDSSSDWIGDPEEQYIPHGGRMG